MRECEGGDHVEDGVEHDGDRGDFDCELECADRGGCGHGVIDGVEFVFERVVEDERDGEQQ